MSELEKAIKRLTSIVLSPGCSLSCEYMKDQEALLVGDHSESCLWRRARVWCEQNGTKP